MYGRCPCFRCGYRSFSHAVLPLPWGGKSSVQLINSLGEDKTIVVVAQREARVDNPQPSDLYTVGTSAVVHKVVKMPTRACLCLPKAWSGCVLSEFTQLAPLCAPACRRFRKRLRRELGDRSAAAQCADVVQQIVAGSPTLSDELSTVALNIDEPGRLVDSSRHLCLRYRPRTSRTRWKLWTFACAWRRSTSILPRNSKCRTAQQDPERSAGSRAAKLSASITCASR